MRPRPQKLYVDCARGRLCVSMYKSLIDSKVQLFGWVSSFRKESTLCLVKWLIIFYLHFTIDNY